jgi:hypothetical protein
MRRVAVTTGLIFASLAAPAAAQTRSPDLPPDLWAPLPADHAATTGSSGGLPLVLGIVALALVAVIGFVVGDRAPAPRRFARCRIALWRRDTSAEFRAVVGRRLIGRSPAFAAPAAGPIPEDDAARGALEELVEHLRSLGWEPSGAEGGEWYALRLEQRPAQDALAVPA